MMSEAMADAERFHYADFTEVHYRELLKLAREGYAFEPFGTRSAGPHILWRHDIDLSVHRALRLAEIEAEEEVRATYFVLLHSSLYNALEKSVTTRLRKIASAGHWIGLHFDPGYYEGLERLEDMEEKMALEGHLLSQVLDVKIETVSLHNPDPPVPGLLERDELAGMLSVYGPGIRERYQYCSDSNGYWRHRRLRDVLLEQASPRLHVLTHPGWWQDSVMSPAQRLQRCVEGRSLAVLREYEAQLRHFGRLNVGVHPQVDPEISPSPPRPITEITLSP